MPIPPPCPVAHCLRPWRTWLLRAASALLVMLVLGAAIPSTSSSSTHLAARQRLTPADLDYRGAFAFPAGDEWAYSGHALAYYPNGDANGPADGYSGSLFAVGHAQTQHVGEITIPAPVISDGLEDLLRATVIQPLADVTGGWLGNCTYGVAYDAARHLIYATESQAGPVGCTS